MTQHRYRLSFTAGGLLVREGGVAAPLYRKLGDRSKVRAAIESENLLQARTVSSGHRLAREVVQRLAELTDDEIDLLADATSVERGHLMWAAACRRYSLLGEFAEEVLRERFLLLAPTLDHSFFSSARRRGAARNPPPPRRPPPPPTRLNFFPGGGPPPPPPTGTTPPPRCPPAPPPPPPPPHPPRRALLPYEGLGLARDRAMTRADLTQQEEHLFSVLSGKRFLQMEGLSNEVPFFIYPYDPEDALEVAQAKKRIKNKLATEHGINVREVNLYDLSVEILKERGVWERVLALEPDQDKDDFREMLQGMLDPQLHIAPAIRSQDRGRRTSTSSSSPASVRSSRTSGRTTCSTTCRAS